MPGLRQNQVLSGDDASGACIGGADRQYVKNRRDYTLVEVLALPLEAAAGRVDGKVRGRFIVQRPGL